MVSTLPLGFSRNRPRMAGGPFCAHTRRMAATARNLGELIAWQLANKHSDAVFELIQSEPCRRDVTFCEQIRDASSAVAPLIAEGFVRFTPAEFAKYLRWAKAEIAETQTHLRNGQAKGYFTEEQALPAWRISKRLMKATSRLLNAKLQHIAEEERTKRARRPRGA